MPLPEDRTANGWNEWSRHVLKELERLNEKVDGLEKSVAKLHTAMAVQAAVASNRGLIAGAIPGVLAAVALLIWKLAGG